MVTEIKFGNRGSGYSESPGYGFNVETGTSVVFEGGHENAPIPIKIQLRQDEDIYKQVLLLINGEIFDLNNDGDISDGDSFLAAPFETSKDFMPGNYQIHALSRDLYNNIKVSEPTQVSIKTISGLRPSVDITYPTAAINTGNESDSALYEAIGISSEIPIFIDAIDEDGNPQDPADLAEVNVYANNQLIGPAKRVGQESLKYYFDIEDLGLNAGRYMFNVGAIDYLGNYARSSNVPIEIVTTKQRPPEISVLNPFAKSDNLSIGNSVHFLVQVREKDRPIRSS